MAETPTVYHAVDSVLSSRERADRVLSLCFDGDVARARRLLVDSGEADSDALLAEGVVGYWSAQSVSDVTYEAAKDVLSRAARLFSDGGDPDRALLADIFVGLCYWRQGQSNEALLFLNRSTQAQSPGIRFMALVNRSVLETERGDWLSGLRTLETAQISFEHEPSLSRRGKFFQQRGLCYKLAFESTRENHYLDRAVVDYEAASDHFERAGNIRFEAAILNNLGNLYRTAGDLTKARSNVDRAIVLYERIGDRPRMAHARDTKALVLLDAGRPARALGLADQAINLLKLHDPGWVTIPMVTKAKILCRMGQHANAQQTFEAAIAIAENADDSTRAADIYLEQADAMADVLSADVLKKILFKANELNPTRAGAIACKLLDRIVADGPRSLNELRVSEHKLERDLILNALKNSNGFVTRAANVLGKTHGGLTHIIRTRHQDLIQHCRPIVKRRKKLSVR